MDENGNIDFTIGDFVIGDKESRNKTAGMVGWVVKCGVRKNGKPYVHIHYRYTQGTWNKEKVSFANENAIVKSDVRNCARYKEFLKNTDQKKPNTAPSSAGEKGEKEEPSPPEKTVHGIGTETALKELSVSVRMILAKLEAYEKLKTRLDEIEARLNAADLGSGSLDPTSHMTSDS